MQQTRSGRRAFCELHPLETPKPNGTMKNPSPQGPKSTLAGLDKNQSLASDGSRGSGLNTLWQGMASKICLAPLAAALIPVAAGLNAQMLPGQAVTTNGPTLSDSGSEPVVKLVDLNASGAALDLNWAPPMSWNPGPPSEQWTAENLGQVFGVCQNRLAANPDIFVASTSIYNLPFSSEYREGPEGPGAIYKLDGTSGAITKFAVLPNSGPGLGNICYSATHQQFYVTNFEDGKIYRINKSGVIKQVFDPFGIDDGAPGFAPLGELVWAVELYHDRSLIFSAWLRDDGAQDTDWPDAWPDQPPGSIANNALFRVELDNFGAIKPLTVELEDIIKPLPGRTYSNPVSDLAIGQFCRPMIAAERTMYTSLNEASAYNDYPQSGAHRSRALPYWVGPSNVSPLVAEAWIGTSGMDSAGGAAFQFFPSPGTSRARWWVSGDALHDTPGDHIYGIQSVDWPFGRVSTASSYLVDHDHNPLNRPETWLGDVEIYNPVGMPCFMISDDCDDPTDIISWTSTSGLVDFNGTFATTAGWGQVPTGGIDGDMWFMYSATQTGITIVDTCASTSLVGNTKIAAWSGTPSCPIDSTLLAVNDDYCGLNSRIEFQVVAGQSYLLQVGSSPGTVGGPGVLTITEDVGIGTAYCPAVTNSSGQPALIAATGSTQVANNDLALKATQLPVGQFGYFLVSQGQDFVPNPPGSSGNLCLGGGSLVGRYSLMVQNSGALGEISMVVDLSALPTPNAPFLVAAQAGETWNFQAWFRDVGYTSNFTDGVSVMLK